MNKVRVNPTSWQERFGFSQGWLVDQPEKVLFVAGQAPVDEDGQIVGEGDVEEQTRQVFTNIARVLEQAGMTFENVVELGVYLTEISEVRTYARVRDEFVNTAAPPASTAVGVVGFALPGMLVEINAVAVA